MAMNPMIIAAVLPIIKQGAKKVVDKIFRTDKVERKLSIDHDTDGSVVERPAETKRAFAWSRTAMISASLYLVWCLHANWGNDQQIASCITNSFSLLSNAEEGSDEP
jgi:hypothetical protein